MENRVLDDLLGKPSESIFHAIPLPDFFKGVKLISPIDGVNKLAAFSVTRFKKLNKLKPRATSATSAVNNSTAIPPSPNNHSSISLSLSSRAGAGFRSR